VNFITCHDGFTLHDLVSYNGKHNEANGENNNDGCNDNASWNCGVEGDTTDAGVLALRRQLMKNYACLLLFASGTPMLLGGDEFARTQRGNNNAYCQDNAMSWFDWDLAAKNDDLFEFFRKAIAFVRRYPILQRRKFALCEDLDDDGIPDFTWFGTDGNGNGPNWHDPESRIVCVQLDASTERGELIGERLFLIGNAHFEPQRVNLPPLPAGEHWRRVIDTSLAAGADFAESGKEIVLDPNDFYLANARSTVVLVGKA
jgi:glycogen operon protein